MSTLGIEFLGFQIIVILMALCIKTYLFAEKVLVENPDEKIYYYSALLVPLLLFTVVLFSLVFMVKIADDLGIQDNRTKTLVSYIVPDTEKISEQRQNTLVLSEDSIKQ